ncbi:hypothetical protein KSC_072010 [Ktedonobacter sp. SOSP1-52]|uniref:hypothetical protein n=1 Tax=Ktedonobacter sp. SOSP1-52 TaxID=2778366 RepID=UPI0019164D48|nr:hypothetical protein [Ktedonobacter sp. SOSP1-52]GHO68309.1 hypothetical protein KSC_072010 [Ktedonobacter sp. SOSP1-52]
MAKKVNSPRKLRVMAEYGSSGIWDRQGMIEHHAFGLPPELACHFDEWITEYTSPLENPGHPLDVTAFNAKGRALEAELKRCLGPKYQVEYAPEMEDGSLGVAESVTKASDPQ